VPALLQVMRGPSTEDPGADHSNMVVHGTLVGLRH